MRTSGVAASIVSDEANTLIAAETSPSINLALIRARSLLESSTVDEG